MRLRTRGTAHVAVALLLLGTLSGCSRGEAPPDQPRRTAGNGEVFTTADVEFASQLIAHHAAAMTLVDLTRGRRLSPEVSALTESIQASHPVEIELMVGWLNAWGEPIPATMRDHVNAGHDDGSEIHIPPDSADIPGMVTAEQLGSLQDAQGRAFETLWLQVMVGHHEGAVELAETEQTDGLYGPAIRLAATVHTTQQAQIDQMRDLLPT